jgi:hypothetical protein
LIVLLSEAQWCFAAYGEAILSNEMTESDSEKETIGLSVSEISHEITEIGSEMAELVGHITSTVGERIEMGKISVTYSQKSFSVNQQLQASVHCIPRK